MHCTVRIWMAALTLGATACASQEAPLLETEASNEVGVNSLALGGLPAHAKWSGLVTLPLVPGAAANLPDGTVVFWAAYDNDDFRIPGTNTVTVFFNPQTGTLSGVQNSNTGHDMFCPGTTNLPDGRILVNGGSTNNKTSIYDWRTGVWTTSGEMSIARGYQANTLLADGSVLTLGGSWAGDRMQSKDAEVWSAGTWRRLPHLVLDDSFNATAPSDAKYLDNHMWLFPMSNGRVLHAGPSVQMHWLDLVGDGAVEPIGPRGTDASSLNGSVAMYDVDKILKVGGARDYGSDAEPYAGLNATNTAHVLELNAAGRLTITQNASMTYARVFAHAVVLPTGQVVVVGGSTRPKLFSDDYAVLAPEIWDPVTRTFATLPAHARARPYHSVALLLTDGRVLVAGGGLGPNASNANHPDLEILSPPYLFNNDGTPAARPAIVSAPSNASHGATISITTDRAVSSFALVRMSSDTHSINNDQRRIPLTFSTIGTNTYQLNIPANRNAVLPGSYMLFAMMTSGTPSIAKVIQLGTTLTPARPAQPPDTYVWRFYTNPATSGRPNARSAYYYVATPTQAQPTPPVGYVLDTTTPSFMFQAWRTGGDGRVAIQLCRSGTNSHWLGNGCNGDTPVQTLFYAYAEPLRGSTKVLHYVSTAWGGKLIIPYTAQTKAQIDALDANAPTDPWAPWINRSPNDRLVPFYVSSTVADRYVWRFFSQPGMRPDVRSDYAYLTTPTQTAPTAPYSYTLDTTTYGAHMFRAWSTPGAERVPIYHCLSYGQRHWLGYGCTGDIPMSILFYAYPNSTAEGNVKSLHYLSMLWGGKLIIPSYSGTAAQIDGLDAATGEWDAWINRTTINRLVPYWVAGP
ncbi:galactose oxidase-like domain-containing protein [Stigmatella aurantiaca]|uniref:Galactose oxidase n=1 Tax=Stigmatella aurantiaca (strain DW4/3-1) TaxID=378806 RepID=Q092H5_STIAD|nr:galactose oxidase-like domain-containing protein [Stigmatella aurantiaca]ADO74264.1 Galactose oxidase [Stigmatella aurantiaca DW4/3-1]EAU66670.1 galactose oxidase [Stigmatella aurantiaca DW4/3-1]